MQLTWSLCFKDQEALSEFSRIIALSRMATCNVYSNPPKQLDSIPVITQDLKKYNNPQQTLNKNEFVDEDQFARFCINGWVINDKEFVYDTHFIINKTQEVVKGANKNEQPAWRKYMIGTKVNETRLIIVPNDGTSCDNNNRIGIDQDISRFIALEISLLERHKFDPTTNQYTKQESKSKETNGKQNVVLNI